MNMKHPRNEILQAIGRCLEPLKTNGEVKKIAVSLSSSKDEAPYIAIRSENESTELYDAETYQRELIVNCLVTVHADDDAVTKLDDLAIKIEQRINVGLVPPDFEAFQIHPVETQFPDLTGDSIAAAALLFRVIYLTPVKIED